ncbi:MAG: hypothetical protein ACJ8AW_34600 [Rhodopila sp.]|jgi:hypothetical protein
MNPDAISYHDLYITTSEIQRTSIRDMPFRVQVRCTRLSGWTVWTLREGNLRDSYLGGEYGGNS